MSLMALELDLALVSHEIKLPNCVRMEGNSLVAHNLVIVSMNFDGIKMGEYASIARDMIEYLCVAFMKAFFIDINIYIH